MENLTAARNGICVCLVGLFRQTRPLFSIVFHFILFFSENVNNRVDYFLSYFVGFNELYSIVYDVCGCVGSKYR